MLVSKSFKMTKGANPTHFRILCAASRILVETGDVLKTGTITDALEAWDVRPVDFAEALAGKPVPVEYTSMIGGAGCPTHIPDDFWREIGTKAVMFKDCKQYLRSTLRMASQNGTLPACIQKQVAFYLYGTITGIYGEMLEEE
jgi:hypothetical protein